MKKWFVFILCLWAVQASAQGTYTAASCSQSAVQAAITSEQAHPVDGDIISIPSGSCSWSGGITQTFNNSVTIQGAGAISATTGGASTTGIDSTSIAMSGAGPLFDITAVLGKSFRITGIAASGTTGILFQVSGTSNAVRVDHCHLSNNAKQLQVWGSTTGVADHDYLVAPSGATDNNTFAFHNGQGWNGLSDPYPAADPSWADTEHWGSSEFFFVEDSYFLNGDLGDAHDGARYVLRHNTYSGSSGQMFDHGLTDARGRSTRAAEVYLNNFNRSAAATNPSYSLNSGALLYWGNTAVNYRYMLEMDYTRKDNSTYGYGSTPNGWGNCNGTTTSTAWDGPAPGYPCLDQPGRGSGDLLNGQNFPNALNTVTGTITWPHQALSPIYVWNNTYNDAGYSPEGILLSDDTTLIADNRDYYQQFGTYGESGSFNGTKGVGQGLLSARPSTCTAGPGGNTPGVGYWATDTNILYVCNPTNTWKIYYTPYSYPHPLTQSSVGTTVAAPTGLAATVQ